MELGATVCTPRAPSCSSCPVKSQCGALSNLKRLKEEIDIEDCDLCLPKQEYNDDLGVMNYPRKVKKTASRDQETLVVIVKTMKESETRLLMERRPSKGLLANLLQFPSVELTPGVELKESEKIVENRHILTMDGSEKEVLELNSVKDDTEEEIDGSKDATDVKVQISKHSDIKQMLK